MSESTETGNDGTPRVLFWAAWGLALLLVVLVVLAPWFDWSSGAGGWRRIGSLFAHDSLVRRTSLACALGLVATAHIFFLPDRSNPPESEDVKQPEEDEDELAEPEDDEDSSDEEE